MLRRGTILFVVGMLPLIAIRILVAVSTITVVAKLLPFTLVVTFFAVMAMAVGAVLILIGALRRAFR